MAGVPIAAAAATKIPWNILLPIALSFVGGLFGKDENEEMMERGMGMQQLLRGMGMRAPYQSPFTKSADTAVFNYILQNLQRYGNFGFPSGMQMDLSFLEDLAGSSKGATGRRVKIT